MPKPVPAPRHLHDAGRALWRRIAASFDLSDAAAAPILTVACEAADRVAEAREAIERDGAYVNGRFGIKQHPGIAVERDSRTQMLRSLRLLGVTEQPK